MKSLARTLLSAGAVLSFCVMAGRAQHPAAPASHDPRVGLKAGFLDAGEHAHQAIVRELKEETGIDITDVRMLHMKTLGRHVEILFAAKADAAGEVLSSEIDHLGWYAFDEIPERLPGDQRQTVQRVLKGEI